MTEVIRISRFFNHRFIFILGFWLLFSGQAIAQGLEFIAPGRLYRSGVDRVEQFRQEMHTWEKSVRGFRRDHNFAVIAGPTRGEWQIDNFGSLSDVTRRSAGYFTQMQYSFHLPIYGGFGYTLGTSTGYLREERVHPDLKPASGGCFPGASLGLVMNFSPALRWIGGLDFYLERWNELGERDDIDEDTTVSVTTRVVDWHTGFDFFYTLYWAVRFEYHSRRLTYVRPFESGPYPGINSDIRKVDAWYGGGLVYHLL